MKAKQAVFSLRFLLIALAVWNIGCGFAALVWPEWLGRARAAEGAALHYIRVMGLFWLFLAFMEGLAAWDLRRFVLAGQLAVLLRLPTGLFHATLLLSAIRSGGNTFVEAWFGLGDLAIFGIGWWLLRQGGSGLLGMASPQMDRDVSERGF